LKANTKVNPLAMSYVQHQKLIAVREMLIANEFITTDGQDKFYEIISKSINENTSQNVKMRHSDTSQEVG
jgi:hypothetical protein